MLAVDREGAVVDGDELIALAALHLRGTGRLPGDGVAVTVMTNYGFHQAMEREGISVATTPVGDRNVLVELLRRGWALGGEQSGPHHRHELRARRRRHRVGAPDDGGARRTATSPTRDAMQKLPQRLVNVRVADRDALEGAQGVWQAVEQEEAALEGRGRVLIRPSGTEPVVRVMVEAPDERECEDVTARLVAAVERELGAP